MKIKIFLQVAVLYTGLVLIKNFALHALNIFTHSPVLHKVDDSKPLLIGDVSENTKLNAYDKYADWVVLMTVNDGYFDFFLNWLWYFQVLKLPVQVVVIAEDESIWKKLSSIKMDGLIVERDNKIDIKEAVPFNNPQFGKIANERPTHILKYLQTGKNVLYCDADTIWLKNPFLYLIGDFDIWAQQDNKQVCTGFLAIRSNPKTVEFIKVWKNYLLKKSPKNDQIGFNRLDMSKVKIERLQRDLFPSGDIYFNAKEKINHSDVVIVHNNFIIGHDKKLKRFKQFHLWYNNTKYV